LDVTTFYRILSYFLTQNQQKKESLNSFISSLATIRYVNVNVVGGTGTGLSWANAYNNLQSAISAAVSGDQIWVAKGTYLPSKDPFGNASPTDPRDKTFYLTNGVALYGGFAGTETLITQRVATNATILSGDIGTINNATDNCYHVVLSVSDANTTKLDGFTITGGNADVFGFITVETSRIYRHWGGGMHNDLSSPSLTNIIFSGNEANQGGGIFNYENCSPTLTNIVFLGNIAFRGGGLYNRYICSPTLTNVVFSKNNATADGGGGIYNESSCSPILTNAVFSGNLSGGIYNGGSCSPIIKNGIFWGNTIGGSATVSGVDVHNEFSSSTLTASYTSMQLANNVTNYPTVGFPNIGTSNNIFAQDPLFRNINIPIGSDGIFMTADDGLELKSPSPCVNAGTATGATTTDITGFARVGNPEMGAYEYDPSTCATFLNHLAYVNTAAVGTNTGESWANAFTSLESALFAARNCGVTQIWVTKGTYNPSADPFGNTNPTDPRDKTFYLENGVAVYGGFVGTETLITQRVATNITILSGDIGIVNDVSDNCYHVVLSLNDVNTTKLDGFTITGGNANGTTTIRLETMFIYQNSGGGMYNNSSSPSLTNVVFSANSTKVAGGGMYNVSSSPSLINVTFLANTANFGISNNIFGGTGGGMSNTNSSPSLINVTFLANTTDGGLGGTGGGMANSNSSPILMNVLFSLNSSAGTYCQGGGMININSSSPILTNVTFSKNASRTGGGMLNYLSSSPRLTNVVFLENSATLSGGGMYNWDNCSPILTNVTFSMNSAGDGGAMWNFSSSTPIIKNGIFWGNTQGGSAIVAGSDVSSPYHDSALTASYTSMQLANNTTNYPTADFPNIGTGNNLFAQDPLFVNAADADGADNVFMTSDDGLSLQSTSPCKDAGTASGAPTTDITGAARVGNVDMGAYEFQGGVLCTSPTGATAGSNSPVTVGSPINLTSSSTGGTSQVWGGPSGFTSTAQNPSIASATSGMAGVYTVTITSSGTCTATATVNVVINPAPTVCSPPTGATAGSNSPVIVGSPINLTSSSTGGTSQVWGGPSGFTSTAQNPNIASATAGMAGVYTVTITSSGTCTATATVNVVINPAPTVCSPPTGATAGSNSPVTVGSPINLTSSSTGGTSQIWAGPSGFSSTAQNPSIASATAGMAGVYTVTITSSGTCTATATVNVVVNPVPTSCTPPTGATAGSNSPVLVGGTINLTSSSTGGTSQTWAGPNSFASTAQNPSIASATAGMAGVYTVTITSSGTCMATATVNVVVNPLPTGAVVFVNVANVSPTQNGNSWATAYSNLQTALSASPTNSEIWVAQGTYKPTATKTQTISFNIPNGAMLFGGFVGTEVAQSQRNFKNNPTILSGEIGLISTVSDNSYHVVLFDGANNTTRLDGFTITGGNASLVADRIRSSPSAAMLPVSVNDGGGIALDNGSSPIIINCKILNNDGVFGGGLFATNASNPTVMNCMFMGNQATFGGGVYHLGSSPAYNNVLFAGNKATGGAVYNNGSNSTFSNVTIAGNGGLNGAIFNSASTPIVKNSIIYGNVMPFNDTQSLVTYSIVEGGYIGIGNLNLNPQFINPTHYGLSPNTSGDYQLTNTSPAIDAGESGSISLSDKDLKDNLRRYNGGIVDMGAYEFQGSRVGGTVISITSGNWENGSTWMGGVSPLAGDSVIINNNHNVTILNSGTAKAIEIRTNAKIIHNSASSKLQTGI
jgi:Right handed beta helix region